MCTGFSKFAAAKFNLNLFLQQFIQFVLNKNEKVTKKKEITKKREKNETMLSWKWLLSVKNKILLFADSSGLWLFIFSGVKQKFLLEKLVWILGTTFD